MFSAISLQYLKMLHKKKIAQMKKLEKKLAFQHKYSAWLHKGMVKRQQLQTLWNKQRANPLSVSIADWNQLVKGSEYTFVAMFNLPRSRWPGGELPLDGEALKAIMYHDQMIKRKEFVNRVNHAMAHVKALMTKAKQDEASVHLEEWEAALHAVDSMKVKSLLAIQKRYPPLQWFVERARVRAINDRAKRIRPVESPRKKQNNVQK